MAITVLQSTLYPLPPSLFSANPRGIWLKDDVTVILLLLGISFTAEQQPPYTYRMCKTHHHHYYQLLLQQTIFLTLELYKKYCCIESKCFNCIFRFRSKINKVDHTFLLQPLELAPYHAAANSLTQSLWLLPFPLSECFLSLCSRQRL